MNPLTDHINNCNYQYLLQHTMIDPSDLHSKKLFDSMFISISFTYVYFEQFLNRKETDNLIANSEFLLNCFQLMKKTKDLLPPRIVVGSLNPHIFLLKGFISFDQEPLQLILYKGVVILETISYSIFNQDTKSKISERQRLLDDIKSQSFYSIPSLKFSKTSNITFHELTKNIVLLPRNEINYFTLFDLLSIFDSQTGFPFSFVKKQQLIKKRKLNTSNTTSTDCLKYNSENHTNAETLYNLFIHKKRKM